MSIQNLSKINTFKIFGGLGYWTFLYTKVREQFGYKSDFYVSINHNFFFQKVISIILHILPAPLNVTAIAQVVSL